jgi:hypothetical protein
MSEIDKLDASILLRQKTVAVIRPTAAGSQVEAAICDFDPAVTPGAPRLKPVESWETVQRG